MGKGDKLIQPRMNQKIQLQVTCWWLGKHMGSKTQEMSIKMANVTIVSFPIFEKLVEICPIFKIYSQILLVIFYVTFSAHSWIPVIM